MNIKSTHERLCKVYTRSITLGVRPVQIWQQGYTTMRFGYSGQVSALLLGAFIVHFKWIFFVYCECHLNASLWHIFVEHQTGVIFMGAVAKHYFATVPVNSPMGCFPHILWLCHFQCVIFYCSSSGKLGQYHSWDLPIMYFIYCFILLLMLSKFS